MFKRFIDYIDAKTPNYFKSVFVSFRKHSEDKFHEKAHLEGKPSPEESIVIGHSAATAKDDSIAIGYTGQSIRFGYTIPNAPKVEPEPKANPFPMHHPLYNFPPFIDDKFIIGNDAIQNITSQVLDEISVEVNKIFQIKAKEVAKSALADSLHYGMYKHLAGLMKFLKYIRNNINDSEEHERIVYAIDKLLDDPYWSKYMDAERNSDESK